MSFCDYLEAKVLDHLFGATSYAVLGNLYLGLSTTTPTDAGANFTEPSGNNYSRVTSVNNPTNWPAASGGSKANGTAITFPTASGSWGTVTYFGIFDQASGGNLLATGELTVSKTISAMDTVQFAVSALTVTLD